MNEQDINTQPADADIDLDDVEAHGIKEVMVGLSAAAVLTGGVAAVVNSGDGPGASATKARISADHDLGAADLSASTSGVDAAAKTDGVLGGAGAAADSSSVSLRPSTSAAGTTLNNDVVDDDISVSVNAGDIKVDTGDTLDTARGAVADTRATVRNAPRTATTTVSNVGATADKAISDTKVQATATTNRTIKAADKTLDATIVFANDTVRGIEGTVSTLTGRIMPSAGMGVNADDLTGWVTLSVGGNQIARVAVNDGSFTVSYTAPSVDAPIQVHYTGPLGTLDRLL